MRRLVYLLIMFVICMTVLVGCNHQNEVSDNPPETEKNIQHVILNINEAENPVFVSVENCPELEGRKDMIDGTDIKSNNNGSIVKLFSCNDFNTAFFGSYEASAVDLDSGTICFDIQKQRYSTVVCEVNYYDLIMNGEAKDCESILITYNEGVELRNITGEFSIFVFTLSDMCPMQFGQSMITVSGTVDETGNVVLNWDGEKFTLKSDTMISNCKAVTEEAQRTKEFIDTEPSTGTIYEIYVWNGIPIITGGIT